MTAALYDCDLRHLRISPVRHAFAYRTHQWLVDLDDLPGGLARFEARDHFGDPAATIRSNVDGFLLDRGIDLRGGRVLMLGNARVFGHVFNPLTLYWCRYPGGAPACVLAEVHNTYGERHCYLLRPDERGHASIDKAFPVSPFFPVDGHYRLWVPEPGQRLTIGVVLYRDGTPVFVASLRGVRLARVSPFHPLVAVAVSLRIRVQGIRLWLRGLRRHRVQGGMR